MFVYITRQRRQVLTQAAEALLAADSALWNHHDCCSCGECSGEHSGGCGACGAIGEVEDASDNLDDLLATWQTPWRRLLAVVRPHPSGAARPGEGRS